MSAALLDFSFEGTAGGYLKKNGVVTEIFVGTPFTVFGRTLSDIEAGMYSEVDTAGQFPATSTYDFGAFGSFQTDETTGEHYSQIFTCFDEPDRSCFFLTDADLTGGIQTIVLGIVTSLDPDDGGIPVGKRDVMVSYSGDRLLTNAAGDELFIAADAFVIESISVTAVPLPAALPLLAAALAGLGLLARRSRRPTPTGHRDAELIGGPGIDTANGNVSRQTGSAA